LLLSVSETPPSFVVAGSAEVLERFKRVRAQSSSGLGLSLVKNLIELHGGVEIESTPRRGTRVTCRLPVGRPDADGVEKELNTGPGCEQSDSSRRALALTEASLGTIRE
jgi:K+-sensing histidine kinase KdpD